MPADAMDILAAIFAYLVCVAGLVGALVMSFVVFFSAPSASSPPTHTVAMMARPNRAASAPPPPLKTVAEATLAEPPAVPPIALDARQKPQSSKAHLRRLAEKQRARQLAYREHSSFESRFLHFDD